LLIPIDLTASLSGNLGFQILAILGCRRKQLKAMKSDEKVTKSYERQCKAMKSHEKQ
jgi:hypothetical protein